MKSLFYQLFFCLLLLANYSQCGHGSNSNEEDDDSEVYQKLYRASYQGLLSLLPPICNQIYSNQNGIRDKYISPKGIAGRLIPAGTFSTTILSFEYIYGLFCPLEGVPPRPLTLESFDLTAYDKDYKLCGYDGQIRNPGLTLDAKTPQERQTNITAVCTIAQLFCNGSLQQYSSFEDCVQFLTNNVPYGSYDRADQGNVACRTLHAIFVTLSPPIHCPHIGPTGGGACTDKTLDFYYSQPDFLACAHKYKR